MRATPKSSVCFAIASAIAGVGKGEFFANALGLLDDSLSSSRHDPLINTAKHHHHRHLESDSESTGHRTLWTGSSAWPPIGQPIVGVTDDSLGSSLALSADGTTLAVGSWSRQKIFVYAQSGTSWVLQTNTPISFGGLHVGISADGTRIATARGSTVYVFEWNGDTQSWDTILSQEEAGSAFNRGVSLSPDGSTVAASGTDSNSNGLVKVWNFQSDGTWVSIGSFALSGGDFGYSVGVHDNLVVIGSPTFSADGVTKGRVTIYEKSGETWDETTFDGGAEDDYFGSSVAISEDGLTTVVCAGKGKGGKGYCRFFSSNGTWQLSGVDDIDGDDSEYLGETVALSKDGSTVAISGGFRYAKDAEASVSLGTVRLFTLNDDSTTWSAAISPIYEVGAGFLGHGLALSSDGGKVAISDPQFAVQEGDTKGDVRVYFTKRINVVSTEDFSSTFEGCSPQFVDTVNVVTCEFTTSPYAYSVASAKSGPCGNYTVPEIEKPTVAGRNIVEYTPEVTAEDKNTEGGVVEKVFCVRSDVMSAIDASGTLMNVDAKKMEVTLSLNFAQTGSFTIADLSTAVFDAESAQAEGTRSVPLTAYQCDEDGVASSNGLTVGDILHICIEISSTDVDVTLTKIESLDLKNIQAIIRSPIVDGNVDFISTQDCTAGNKCIVGTLMIPSILDEYSNSIIQVLGVASIEYSRRRNLSEFDKTNHHRSLQVATDQSSFFMSFDLSDRTRPPLVVGPRANEDLPMVARAFMSSEGTSAKASNLFGCVVMLFGTVMSLLIV